MNGLRECGYKDCIVMSCYIQQYSSRWVQVCGGIQVHPRYQPDVAHTSRPMQSNRAFSSVLPS